MSEKESGQVSHILPLSQLPCANLQDQGSVQCLNRGDKACSKCRLVSYCSKECQQNHWKLHKSDCKNPLRSSEWVPTCDREGRPPSYPDAPTPGDDMVTIMRKLEINKKFSTGMWLWGNTPAVDLLNLQSNEGDSKRDYNLLFAASGDLRNVIKTVNNLPRTSLELCCRNLTLLLILSTVSDDALAADVALHFWFSVFLPEEYRSHSSQEPFRLTPSSTLTVTPNTRGPLGSQITEVLKSYQQPAKFAAEDAIQEIHRRREDPQWNDFRETRLYFRLRPSHRVAFRKARHTGLVLPFGASSKAFKAPNSSLFTPTGGWLLTAEVDPLHGWK
ncbi:hypothetical protein BKA70DRAFT_1286599 [Coprinopsis sp. MPI-PUGE-AT-0042]|nr:hypothetical protein BKA70DRAFT_1286599 [Coprinopsis sp. MPI-PUGE-AT-0042]